MLQRTIVETIADYCVVAYYGRSFPKVKWFKAYCEFVSVATEDLVSNREVLLLIRNRSLVLEIN